MNRSQESINRGARPTARAWSKILSYAKCRETKITALMIAKGVEINVSQFRAINQKAQQGLKQMEWNAFRSLHGIR